MAKGKTKKAAPKKSLMNQEELEFREKTLEILKGLLEMRSLVLDHREEVLDGRIQQFEKKQTQVPEQGCTKIGKKEEVVPAPQSLSPTAQALEQASRKRELPPENKMSRRPERRNPAYQYVQLEGGRSLSLPLHLKPNEYTKIKEIYSAALRASEAGWGNFWTMATSNPDAPEQVAQNNGDEFLDRINQMASAGDDMLFLFAIAKQVQELEADICQL